MVICASYESPSGEWQSIATFESIEEAEAVISSQVRHGARSFITDITSKSVDMFQCDRCEAIISTPVDGTVGFVSNLLVGSIYCSIDCIFEDLKEFVT